MVNKVIVPLWKGEGNLPAYSEDKYSEYDAARLRALVYANLPMPHEFVILCDDYFYNRISELQSHFEDTDAPYMVPDRDVVITPEQEEEDGPPYVSAKPSPLNWLSGVTLWKFSGDDVGGWSRVLEAFQRRPGPGERFLMMGLDTLPVGDLRWLFEWNLAPVGLPNDPLYNGVPCSAVISYDTEGAEILYNEYLAAKNTKMSRYLMGGRPSEMMLMRALAETHSWPRLEGIPKKLLSYKAHVMKTCGPYKMLDKVFPLTQASLVYFHGNPKPSALDKNDPLGKLWNSV